MTAQTIADFFTPEDVENIRQRRRFASRWGFGYLTRGGTYIVATNGAQTDSRKPRDLVVVLPVALAGDRRVIPLTPLVHPTLVGTLERELQA